ncbi:MAG: RHS repeat domain-containing protein, partial [Beijerinckiaceae bacterium]
MAPLNGRPHAFSQGQISLNSLIGFGLIALILVGLSLLVTRTAPSTAVPAVGIEVPSDPKGRRFIGVGDGLLLTVRAEGTAPVTVELGQTPARDPGGVMFYGESGRATTASLTTRGGEDNSAQIRVRGDRARPSRVHGDVWLTASVSGVEVSREPVTVLRLALDKPSATLLNDAPVIRTLTTTPATPDLDIAFRFFRQPLKDKRIREAAETFYSVQVTPLDAATVRTDANGIARLKIHAGFGGQGAVAGQAEVVYPKGGPGTIAETYFYLSNERICCDCCPSTEQDAQDPGISDAGSFIATFAGETKIHTTDSAIPGRGFDWTFSRSYRSEAGHLRPAATGDFAKDWAFNYSDDRLLQDGKNIVKFGGELRTDVFIASDRPGVFIAPMEYYEQLVFNAQGDLEIRRPDGMIMTYRGFGKDPKQPTPAAGRLMQMEDRNGNVMRFLYGKPPGLDKLVLTTVVDTMGRDIVYRYYPADDPKPGRRGRLKDIEDFRRDNKSPTGRQLRFDYDPAGNLYSVTGPKVLNTPTGNDFLAGKTYRFRYLQEADLPPKVKGLDRTRLLHNLLAIEHPNETAVDLDPDNPQTLRTKRNTPRERLNYGTDPKRPESFDRVLRYGIGGTNGNGVPAGGTIHYAYQQVAPYAGSTNAPFLKTRVTDRRGNLTDYVHSPFDTLLEKREYTRGFRKQEPKAFVTYSRYNHDKERVQTTLPESNSIAPRFDENNRDRFQQGNNIRTVRTPDARRGGDQTALFSETVYEPIYQQPAAVTDSRGLDPAFVPPIPDVCDRSQRERYTTRHFFDYQEGDPAAVLPLLAEELRTSEAEVRARLQAAGMELGLGDVNGDGDTSPQVAGNVVRRVEPSVVLLEGSNQAAIEGDRCQDIVTLSRYNRFGQMISMVDAEGNVHINDYFPETDPDGDGALSSAPADGRPLDSTTGGYLAEEIKDTVSDPIRNNRTNPPPVNIRTAFTYDDVGNQTTMTDGRGIRTDYFVNELNQVVQTVRAAAVPAKSSGDPPEPMDLVPFSYKENVFYDFNNNVTLRQVEDRGNTSNTGGFVDYTHKYDILDNVIEKTEEVDVTETLVHRHRYDPNQNRTLEIWPEGNAATSLYDERDLLLETTSGALNATAETLAAPSGPYNPRGGVPSVMTHHYDRNRNAIEEVDAADTDGSAANNSKLGGGGDRTRTLYDGFDRRSSVIDSVGNRSVTQYDPAGNVVRMAHFGPVGGASPTSDGPDVLPIPVSSGGLIQAANLVNANLLAATETLHDELNRAFQTDQVLFVSTIPTVRPVDVADGASDLRKGNLTPGDNQSISGITGTNIIGRVTARMEYDRNSRGTFAVEDDGDTSQSFYDGADRVTKTVDPESNSVEMAYDDNNNIIERKETDVSQVAGIIEIFLATNFYDSLNRIQRSVDNIGQTMDYRYDSRDNPVAMADAQGPLSGASIARRAFTGGALTVNTINDFGNVTRYFYDGINRKIQEDAVLTDSAQGDGVNIGAALFGVKTATPTPSLSQGGGDGLITVRHDWDGNSLLASLTDDNGNQTRYSFDNLNRRLTETKGIVVSPALADRADPPTTITMEFDPDDNVVRLTDENGSRSECQFDAINRRIDCMITHAPGVVGTTAVSYRYDGLSRLTLAKDNNEPGDRGDDSIITYARDSLSRIIEETQKIGELPAKAISSAWRAENLRTRLTYPNDRALEYNYDGLDRLATVADQGAAQNITDYKYIGVNRVLGRRYPINGTRMTYLDDGSDTDVGYDGLRRPTRLRHLRADNSLIVGFTHTYDRMNNRQIEEKLHATGESEGYDYDSAYRLIKLDRGALNDSKTAIVTPSANVPIQTSWNLDGVGNWASINAGTETRQHSAFNEIVRRVTAGTLTNILSDDNGNETDDGIYTFAWDYRNRLKVVTRRSDGQVVAEYTYDESSRRIRRVVK